MSISDFTTFKTQLKHYIEQHEHLVVLHSQQASQIPGQNPDQSASQSDSYISALTAELEKAKEDLRLATFTNESRENSLKKEIDILKKTAETLKDSVTKKDSELIQSKTSLSEATITMKHLTENLKDRDRSLQQLEKKMAEFGETMKKSGVQLSMINTLIEREEEKARKTVNEMSEKDALITKMHRLLSQQSKQLKELQDTNNKLTQENRALQLRADAAEERVEVLTREHSMRAANAAAQLMQERERAEAAFALSERLSSSVARYHLLNNADALAAMQMEDARARTIRTIELAKETEKEAFAEQPDFTANDTASSYPSSSSAVTPASPIIHLPPNAFSDTVTVLSSD